MIGMPSLFAAFPSCNDEPGQYETRVVPPGAVGGASQNWTVDQWQPLKDAAGIVWRWVRVGFYGGRKDVAEKAARDWKGKRKGPVS